MYLWKLEVVDRCCSARETFVVLAASKPLAVGLFEQYLGRYLTTREKYWMGCELVPVRAGVVVRVAIEELVES